MTVFPAPWPVQHEAYAPTDGPRGRVDGWAPPTIRYVIGWAQPASREPRSAGVAALVVDLELYVGPEWRSGENDRITVDGERFLQEGLVADYNHGPFGFTPGGVVHLRRVK